MLFTKKPVTIKAITFDEFVKFAQETTDEPHWSIPYEGVTISHENDECYIIPTLEGNHRFTPEDMLITGIKGEIYPCKIDIFHATYTKGQAATNKRGFETVIEGHHYELPVYEIIEGVGIQETG